MTPYYQDESVTLYCGDCREILPALGPVDHVITDPPYDEHTHGAQRRGSSEPGRGKQFGLSRASISVERHVGFAALSEEQTTALAIQFARLSKRWIVIFCAMEQQSSWMHNLTAAGVDHVRFGIWHKPGSTPQFSGDRPGTPCEAIEIAHRRGRKRWNGGGGFAMWTAPIVKAQTGERVHPTQKPEPLMRDIVADFTDPDDAILDPFAGSGTTLVAAKRLGRKAIGIELNPAYCDVAVSRLRQGGLFAADAVTTASQASLLGDGEVA